MKLFKLIIALGAMLLACAGAFADPDMDLYNAVKINSLSKVQMALRMGANPNQKIAVTGLSSFALAVENDNTMIMETMLSDAIKEPVAINGDGNSEPPLFIAARCNSLEALKYLLSRKGININVKYNGDSILYYVLKMGDKYPVLSKIIEYNKEYHCGLNFSEYDPAYNRTVLHFAVTGGNYRDGAANGNVNNVKVLINSGEINVSTKDSTERNALYYACASGKIDMGRLFLQYPREFIEPADNGMTPLSALIKYGKENNFVDTEFIEKIVKSAGGIKINSFFLPSEQGFDNGLIELAKINSDDFFEIAKQLPKGIVSQLAKLQDREKNSFLCIAIQEKWNSELVDLLIDKYDGDWKKIKMETGKYKKLNAIEIMRKNHTEDLYEDIFNDYM